MKKYRILVGITLLAFILGCQRPAEKTEGEAPSAPVSALAGMNGKEIFKSTALGTSGKACNSCHPDGDGLNGVGDRYSQNKELQSQINKCIAGPLKGKELGMESSEMKALATYVRSL
jgi:mono/diheme cytochrome c family protein